MGRSQERESERERDRESAKITERDKRGKEGMALKCRDALQAGGGTPHPL